MFHMTLKRNRPRRCDVAEMDVVVGTMDGSLVDVSEFIDDESLTVESAFSPSDVVSSTAAVAAKF